MKSQKIIHNLERIVKNSIGTIRFRMRILYNHKNRRRLNNSDFSVIASNCNGACILHDLGQQFNSPFVNLWLKPNDFLKLLENMDYYLKCNLTFKENTDFPYPVGLLDDVEIYFQHYSSQAEALEKWNERSKRINKENLFILFSDRDGCTYQDLQRFDALPYENKIVFTHLPHPELSSCYYIKGWEKENCVGHCMDFKSRLSYHKYYDDFDYVSWFNHTKASHK